MSQKGDRLLPLRAGAIGLAAENPHFNFVTKYFADKISTRLLF